MGLKKLYFPPSLGFPEASVVKNPPAMQEMQDQSLNQEDPLEEEMTAHSRILAWKIPEEEEPGRLQSMGLKRVGHDWACMHLPFYSLKIFALVGQKNALHSPKFLTITKNLFLFHPHIYLN